MSLPRPDYSYLLELIDDTGIFEHCRHGVPRREHGYTMDDAARALVVLCDAPIQSGAAAAIRVLLAFTLDAFTPQGRFRNRLRFDRQWLDDSSTDDAQGRTIWALSVVATKAPRPDLKAAAASALTEVRSINSSHLRPLAFSSLGAHALWVADPADPRAAEFAGPMAERLRGVATPWPESRLTYANGRIPAGIMAAGTVFDDTGLIERGLTMLSWLVRSERHDGHFSFTPVAGRIPGGTGPAFDQQPIEVAAMADACERAWSITGDERWRRLVLQCGEWLLGANDVGLPMYHSATGATADGLLTDSVNANCGAESTIAGLAVLQACQRAASGEPSWRRREETARTGY